MKFHSKAAAHTAGALSYALLQWLVLTMAARFISLETAGLYVYYLAIFTPASILLSFGLRNATASDIRNEYSNRSYFQARFVGAAGMVLVFILVITLVRDSIMIASVVFLIKLLDLWSEILYGAWIRNERGELYGVSKVIRLFVFLGLFAISYQLGMRGELLLACYPVAMLLGYSFYDRPRLILIEGSPDHKKHMLRALIQSSAPLALGSFIVALTATMPRIIVKNVLDAESAALYAMLIYLVSLAAIPVGSASQTFIPRFARHAIHPVGSKLINAFTLTLVYGLFFAAAMIVFGNIAMTALYDLEGQYSMSDFLLVGLGAIAIFATTVGNSMLVAARKFRATLVSAAFGVICVVICTYALVSRHGLGGAFAGFMIASVVTAVAVWYFVGSRSLQSKSATVAQG